MIVNLGVLARVAIDQSTTDCTGGVLSGEAQLIDAIPCPTAMHVKNIVFQENEPLLFHPVWNEAITETLILRLSEFSLEGKGRALNGQRLKIRPGLAGG